MVIKAQDSLCGFAILLFTFGNVEPLETFAEASAVD